MMITDMATSMIVNMRIMELATFDMPVVATFIMSRSVVVNAMSPGKAL